MIDNSYDRVETHASQGDFKEIKDLIEVGDNACFLTKAYFYEIDAKDEAAFCDVPLAEDGYWKSIALVIPQNEEDFNNLKTMAAGGAALGTAAGIIIPGLGNLVGGLIGAVVGGIVGGIIDLFSGDWDSQVWCDSTCMSWNFNDITNVCGNDIFERPYEECDDGKGNSASGNCSVACLSNYCKNTQVHIDVCQDYTGMLCKNFGNETHPKPALVPNCAGQFGSSCNSCALDEICSIGAVDVPESSYAYKTYVPFETNFLTNDTFPTMSGDGQGTAFASSNGAPRDGVAYEIVKYSETGQLFFNFTFPVERGKTYVAKAFVKTAGNKPNESVRIFGAEGESDFAPVRPTWNEIKYEFVAGSSKHTMFIEVNKRGTFYVDEISVKRLDSICQPKCRILEARFTKDIVADKGTEVTATVKYTGACQTPFNLEIDAASEDGSCIVSYDNDYGQEGWVKGIDTVCSEGDITGETTKTCTKKWTVPHVPEACAGKTVSATFATLWVNGIGFYSGGSPVAQLTLDYNSGYFRFADNPVPLTCGNDLLDNDIGEICDSSAGFTPFSCSALNSMNSSYPVFVSGDVTCTNRCGYDISQCLTAKDYCGNGNVDFGYGESCDPGSYALGRGVNLTGRGCKNLTYANNKKYLGGSLGCYAASSTRYCQFDTTACTKPVFCGDGVRDSDEECDGSDFGEFEKCNDYYEGYDSHELVCSDSCTFDLSVCTPSGCRNGAPDGLCEMAFETRNSCPEDCFVTFENIRAEQGQSENGNFRFVSSYSPQNTVFDTFIVCKYNSMFSNRQNCISIADSGSCGINSVTGEISDCICSSMTPECRLICYDIDSTFYLYGEGFSGISMFKVQSDKKPFSCQQVGLAQLKAYKDVLDRMRERAYRNWQYALQHNLSSAPLWLEVLDITRNTVITTHDFLQSIQAGALVSQNDINLMIDQAIGTIDRVRELLGGG
jgi:hypothetical protein